MSKKASTPRDPKIDLTGKRFGRLTAMAFAGNKRWHCRCACGKWTVVLGYHLKAGNIQSCGCLRLERAIKSNSTHGCSAGQGTTEYNIWCGMKHRCFNPNAKSYHRYGGRGIRVCDRWRDSFEAFLEDMGVRPSAGHSIDRINNDGNYEPGNCRWATRAQQVRNSQAATYISAAGKTLCIKDWAEVLGIEKNSLSSMIRYSKLPKEEYIAKKLIERGITVEQPVPSPEPASPASG